MIGLPGGQKLIMSGIVRFSTCPAYPPDIAVARTAAWARATMHHWGLGGLADDAGLIVAEFSSNPWTHASPPVEVTPLLQERVLTIEVSDAGAGLAVFAGPRALGAGGHGLPVRCRRRPADRNQRRRLGTRVWARLHFQWVPAETEPGPRPPERHHPVPRQCSANWTA